jgi:hypothetical protein
MTRQQQLFEIHRLIQEHVQSPSLRHIRDARAINTLAQRILDTIERRPDTWQKWTSAREELIKAAAQTWIPVEALRDAFNDMPGPKLTSTDVAQRLRALHEETYARYPDEALKESCLAIFEREKAAGTEFVAIVGALQEFVEEEGERRRKLQEQQWRESQQAEREALELRFLSGADSKWTPIRGSTALYIRLNGRAYRLAPTKDKRWDMFRIESVEDVGKLVGTYQTRGDASKALKLLAYQPEPRW